VRLPWLDPLRQQLDEALGKGRLGHAPLIQGAPGMRSSDLAEWLLRRILCLEPVDGQACGQCRACQLLDSDSHPDCFRVGIPEDKKEIPIDSIRGLSGKLQLTASLSPHRVGLIEPAEAMNRNAANALLKTLEEPASDAWLILVSDQPGRLPATIRSRCQPVSVRPPGSQEALAWLEDCVPGQSAEALAQALRLAGGAPLAARSLLIDQGLEFGLSLRAALLEIGRGRPLQGVVDEHWLNDPVRTWRWLATWTAAALQHALLEESGDGSTMPPRGGLAKLWQQALEGVALARGNARQDLLLGKWLLEWKAASQHGN